MKIKVGEATLLSSRLLEYYLIYIYFAYLSSKVFLFFSCFFQHPIFMVIKPGPDPGFYGLARIRPEKIKKYLKF